MYDNLRHGITTIQNAKLREDSKQFSHSIKITVCYDNLQDRCTT